MNINITRTTGDDDRAIFPVQIGPLGHVCSTTYKFFESDVQDEGTTYDLASAFADGAYSALATASGLAQRFIDPDRVTFTAEDV